MWLLLCVIVAVSAFIPVLVLKSTLTPPALLDLLSPAKLPEWLPSDMRVATRDSSDLPTAILVLQSSLAVLDVSFSSLDRLTIADACREHRIPHIVLGYSSEREDSSWTYSVSPSYQQLAAAVQSILVSFGWNRVTVAVDDNDLSMFVSSSLRKSAEPTYDIINFSLQDDLSIARIVGRSMRNMGNRVTVFLTQPLISGKIEAAQRSKAIAGAGFANLLVLASMLDYAGTDGDLVVAEAGMTGVAGESGFYHRLMMTAGGLLANCSDAQAVLQRLQAAYPSHYPAPVYTLLNVRSGELLSVGHLEGSALHLTDTVLFPGNASSVSASLKSPLRISGNFGVRNANSIVLAPVNYYRGALLAVAQVNQRRDVLDNFLLEVFNFTAGVQVWNYEFALQNVYPVRDHLGLAVMTSTSSALTIKMYEFLKQLNYSGAVIGASNTVDALSSRNDYPDFLRTILPDKFITYVYVQMFKRFSWQKCALFVSNEIWGLSFRSEFSQLAQANRIEIINSLDMQVLPTPIPSLDTLRNYTANFMDFLNCKAKILVIVVNNNAVLVIDYLYELGVRGGEVQIVANEWLSLSFITTNNTQANQQRSELLRGAIQFSPLGFVGRLGEQMRGDFKNQYGVTPPLYACFYYDAVLTIAYALDLVIHLGNDYMNPEVLQKALRAEKFTGCTGTVLFDSDTNDRSLMQYSVLNAQFGELSSVITAIVPVGSYDPTSTVLFRFTSDIIWCDGTTTIPVDLRASSIGCPFEDKYDRDFPTGRGLVYALSGGFFAFVLAFTLFVWKTWWQPPVRILKEMREMQPLDTVVFVGMIVETCQLFAIGPALDFMPYAFTLITNACAMDLSLVIAYLNGGFEIVWFSAFGLFLAWVLMAGVILLHIDQACKRIPGMRHIGEISEALVPILSDYCFLPVLSVLTSSFACVRGVGEVEVGFTDSYLESDCFLQCWRSTHLVYVIGAGVALLVYTPVCIFARPLWQEMQEFINIKAAGRHMMAKSLLQVCVVLLNKAMRRRYPWYHAFVFLGVLVIYFAFTAKYAPFGYRRASFWYRVSLLAVLWSSALSVISQRVEVSWVVFSSVSIFGWVVFGVLGYLYMRYNILSYLYYREGVALDWLFRFAFKPTTLDLVKALKDNFEKVGHRNVIVVPRTLVERKGETLREDMSAYHTISGRWTKVTNST